MQVNRALSIRHFRCFIEVANSGSFTIAASRLFITQSALTMAIQQFEEAVGMKLFDRNTRRVAMTPEAASFKPQAERIVRDFDASVADLESFAHVQQGHMRIAAAPSVLYLFLARAVTQFRKQYPNVKLTLRDANAQQVEQLVADGELDFAIATKFRGVGDLEYTPLIQDSFGVICRADYPIQTENGWVCLESLPPSDYIAFTADTGIGSLTRKQAPKLGSLQEASMEVSSSTSLLAVLNEGGSFAIAPALTSTISGFESLKFYELAEPKLVRQSFLITRKLRSLSPSSQRLLQLISEIIAKRELPGCVTSLAKADLGSNS